MKQSNPDDIRTLKAPHLPREDQAALEEGAILMDPEELDSAIVGVIRHDDGFPVAVYRYGGLVDAYANLFAEEGDEAAVQQAEEWVQYNTLRSLPYTPGGPVVVTELEGEEEDEEDESAEEYETLDVAGKTWRVVEKSPPSKPPPAKPRRGKREESITMPRKPNAAFMAPKTPSPELAVIVGSKPLPRTEVTKKVWDYIKKHNLQNPANKREILADDKLLPILGKKKVTMFEMTAIIAGHLS